MDANRTSRRRRVVLILPSESYRSTAFMDAATRLDVEVVVATEVTPPLATAMEDRLVRVELDLEAAAASAGRIAALAERREVDAVIGVDDQGVLIAAHAAELLDLTGNPPDAVAATRNKIDMRRILDTWRVPQPRWTVVEPDTDLDGAAATVGFPAVVKPISLAASTGVIRADSADELREVVARVRTILVDHDRSADEPLLLEQFVAGDEISLEGLLENGRLEVLALFDKPDASDGPYFEETIYTTPTRLSDDLRESVVELVADGCRALGLREGPVHGEVRIDRSGDDARSWLLEIAGRSIGGLCSRSLTFGTSSSLEELILRHALGLDRPGRDRAASGVMMLPIPGSGTLRRVDGIDEARAVPGIVDLEISIAIDRPVEALPEGGRYLGFLFARGDTAADVEASLRAAQTQLRFEITPDTRPRAPVVRAEHR